MADDLVQRLRAFPNAPAEPALCEEAADALARKDAEIARRGKSMRELEDMLESRRTEIRELRRQVSGAKDVLKAMERSLASSESQRDEQRHRAERAEARVREAPVKNTLVEHMDDGGKMIWMVDSTLPTEYEGKRVALVLLKEPQE